MQVLKWLRHKTKVMNEIMNNAIISFALIKLLIPSFSGFDSNGTSAFTCVRTISVEISVGEVIIGLSSTYSSVRIPYTLKLRNWSSLMSSNRQFI